MSDEDDDDFFHSEQQIGDTRYQSTEEVLTVNDFDNSMLLNPDQLAYMESKRRK